MEICEELKIWWSDEQNDGNRVCERQQERSHQLILRRYPTEGIQERLLRDGIWHQQEHHNR